MRSTSPWIGTRAKTASWCHPISDAECVPLALFVRKGKTAPVSRPAAGAVLGGSFPCGPLNQGPLSVGGCFAYSCAVIAVDGGILPRNQEKVKGIEAKSDFNTVEDKSKALSAQCAHWAPPPQGEARGTWRTDHHAGAMPLLAMTAGAAVLSGPPLSWWSSRADEDIRLYLAPPAGADSPYQGEMSRRDKRDRDPGTAEP